MFIKCARGRGQERERAREQKGIADTWTSRSRTRSAETARSMPPVSLLQLVYVSDDCDGKMEGWPTYLFIWTRALWWGNYSNIPFLASQTCMALLFYSANELNINAQYAQKIQSTQVYSSAASKEGKTFQLPAARGHPQQENWSGAPIIPPRQE